VELIELGDDEISFERDAEEDAWYIVIRRAGSPPLRALVSTADFMPLSIVLQWEEPQISIVWGSGIEMSYLVWYRGHFILGDPRSGYAPTEVDDFRDRSAILGPAVADDPRWQAEVNREAFAAMLRALPDSETKDDALQLEAEQRSDATVQRIVADLSARFGTVDAHIKQLSADRIEYSTHPGGPWHVDVDGRTLRSWEDREAYRDFLYQQIPISRFVGRTGDQWVFQVRGWTLEVAFTGLPPDAHESDVAQWMELVLLEQAAFEEPCDPSPIADAVFTLVGDDYHDMSLPDDDPTVQWWRYLRRQQVDESAAEDEHAAVRRRGIPQAVRREVWRRDEGRCVDCGSKEKLEYDHIIPYSRGGSDTVRNLQLLCEPCNRRKSATI
jgi:hypothetical protein